MVDVRVTVDASFHAARTRLKILAEGTMLPRAAEMAYGEGTTGLAESAGAWAGPTRLADVYLQDLTETDDCAHIALQWDAIAPDGKLFTVLLGDLMAIPAGDQITTLSLTGSYWPPPRPVGAWPDLAAVRCYPTAVIGSFLDSVARGLADPAGTPGPSGHSPVP